MSFDSLPLEIVQYIFNYLPVDYLLNISLVCHRWNQAVEPLIAKRCWLVIHSGRITELPVLNESQRNYRDVLFHQLNDWEQLQPIFEICTRKIYLRRVKICRALVDCFYRFYQLYPQWLESVEEIHISFDHRFLKHDTLSGKCYTIRLAKARCLFWSENHLRRGNRTVTVYGHGLKKISVNDSFGSKLNLILPDCDIVETLECTLYRKSFSDIFRCTFNHLNTLTLRIYSTVENVQFLNALPNLRRLNLSLEYEKELLHVLFADTVSAICGCTLLEALQLHITNGDILSCCLNLSQIVDSLNHLQQLELKNMYLESTGQSLSFQRLSMLMLSSIFFKHDNSYLTVDCPLLQTISVSIQLLPNFFIGNDQKPKTFCVNLEALSLKESFDTYLVPFFQRTKQIQDLVLFRPECQENVMDVSAPHTATLGVNSLHLLSQGLSLETLRRIAECPRLKHLRLSRCTVGNADTDHITVLENLETLGLFWVQLDNRKQKMFPIARRQGEQLIGEEFYNSLIIFSTKDCKPPFELVENNVVDPV